MKSKNKSFKGYKPRVVADKPKMNIPKLYKVNGYYLVGEDIASMCIDQGMKVEEVKNMVQ